MTSNYFMVYLDWISDKRLNPKNYSAYSRNEILHHLPLVTQTMICFDTEPDLANVRWWHNDGTKWCLIANHNTLVLHSAKSSPGLHPKHLSKSPKYFWVQINDIIMTYSWFDTNNKDDTDTDTDTTPNLPGTLEACCVINPLSYGHLVAVAVDDKAAAAADVRVPLSRCPQGHSMTPSDTAPTRVTASKPLPLKDVILAEDAIY